MKRTLPTTLFSEGPLAPRPLYQQALLDVLSSESGAAIIALLKQLTVLDWEAVAAQSVQLDVAPLLYGKLKKLGCPIPKNAMLVLQSSCVQNASRNLRIYSELDRVLNALHKHDIPVIVLKGLFLAQTVYGSIGLRSMADVDLLVHKEDIRPVEQVVLELGFLADPKNGTEHAISCSHNVYNLAEHKLSLEVHWNIEGDPSPFLIDVDPLWERSEPMNLNGVQVRSLSSEDLLLHLSLHASFHHLFKVAGLRSLCDVALCVQRYGSRIDWGRIWSRSQEWRARNSVYLTLYLAKKLLHAGIPELALRDLEPNDFNVQFAQWAEERVLSANPGPMWTQSDNWGRLRASKRFRDSLSVLFATCFPSRRLLAQIYSLPPSSRRLFLYYPIRLGALARRHSHRIWLLLKRDARARAWAQHEANRVEETAIKRVLLRNDDIMKSWIEQDEDRAANLAVVRWLASG